MLYQIQSKLVEEHPQMKEKRLILQYYMSVDHLQKQRKIINWWEMMVEAAIKISNQVYISPSDLEVIFTIHGLKPVPLLPVLRILTEAQKLQWRDQDIAVSLALQNPKRSIIKQIANAIIPPKEKSSVLTQYKTLQKDTSSKIISTNYLRELVDKVKTLIQTEMNNDTNIQYDYMINKLKKELPILVKSIEFLLDELVNRLWIVIDYVQGRKVIFFSNDLKTLRNPSWLDMEKIKFQLKSTIRDLNKKVQYKSKLETNKYQQAKKYVEIDKDRAKKILHEIKNIQIAKENIETRLRALYQKFHELELNLLNAQTINTLQQAQSMIKLTMRDSSVFDNITEQNQEIKIQQKEINVQFEKLNEMNKDDDIQQEVDNIMAELEKQIKIPKQKILKQGPSVRVFNKPLQQSQSKPIFKNFDIA